MTENGDASFDSTTIDPRKKIECVLFIIEKITINYQNEQFEHGIQNQNLHN